MPPKRKRQTNFNSNQRQLQDVDELPEQHNHSGSTDKLYECQCGKKYKSHPAANNHIKIKHKEEQSRYNLNLKKPIRDQTNQTQQINNQESESVQLRVDHVDRDDMQFELNNLTDQAILSLSKKYKKAVKQKKVENKQILNDNNKKWQEQGTRTESFKPMLQKLAQDHQMSQIISQGKNDQIFQVFRIGDFQLNFIQDLSKFFVTDFAAKIDFSLKIIHANEKKDLQSLKEKIQKVLDEIWQGVPEIKDELFDYYREWDQIRLELQEQKKNQRQTSDK